MRVFISWSKSRGKLVAQALAEWIPTMNHLLKPWTSPEIKPGSRWRDVLYEQLRDIDVGIICVTPEALFSPWLNFEAGALGKSVGRGIVCPYIFGMDPDQDTDNPLRSSPLSDFQYVKADREGTLRLVRAINDLLPSRLAKSDEGLRADFEDKWPRLERVLSRIHAQPSEAVRDQARQALESINRGAGPLPSEVGRSLWMPVAFQQIRAHLDGPRKTPPTLDLFDINALAPLHAGFEMFVELLAKGGRVRLAMLDPRSKAFAARSKLERDDVGRIAAEEVASFHIIEDILEHTRSTKRAGHLEVRLSATLPESALVLVEAGRPNGLVLANPYPTEADKRGLAFPWYSYTRADGVLYARHCDVFKRVWNAATRVVPRSTMQGDVDWPFEAART